MSWVAGADGCNQGWFRAARETRTGALHFVAVEAAADLLVVSPRPEVLAIDIPIGLPESGRRECDVLARRHLGRHRASSVFSPPTRSLLHCETHAGANQRARQLGVSCVSIQAFGLFRKIDAVDALLGLRRDPGSRVREVHPELCFWAWNDGRPMAASKKSAEGRKERLSLVEGWLGLDAFAAARAVSPRNGVADDDILDAFAALWTATRIANGEARTLPEHPPRDGRGLPMQIVY